ncbi:MAG: GNAT family N-acetyltransferase [Rhodospirillales bacterium]|nr:GNAT family N-acetyltransferase [Rhodospirillales bacterium]
MSELATLRQASGDDMAAVRALFEVYGRSLNYTMCFEGFGEELATLPGFYAPPRGRLLLAEADDRPVGVVALRPQGDDACEMKRLYVEPAHRGGGLGVRLARAIVEEGARAGYRAIRLETLDSMTAAMAIYRGLGFRETPATRAGIRCFERPLA